MRNCSDVYRDISRLVKIVEQYRTLSKKAYMDFAFHWCVKVKGIVVPEIN
jgi:hypothetical protein